MTADIYMCVCVTMMKLQMDSILCSASYCCGIYIRAAKCSSLVDILPK
jgi:hypothetical protein